MPDMVTEILLILFEVSGYEDGNFVGPTILSDVTSDMECYKVLKCFSVSLASRGIWKLRNFILFFWVETNIEVHKLTGFCQVHVFLL